MSRDAIQHRGDWRERDHYDQHRMRVQYAVKMGLIHAPDQYYHYHQPAEDQFANRHVVGIPESRHHRHHNHGTYNSTTYDHGHDPHVQIAHKPSCGVFYGWREKFCDCDPDITVHGQAIGHKPNTGPKFIPSVSGGIAGSVGPCG